MVLRYFGSFLALLHSHKEKYDLQNKQSPPFGAKYARIFFHGHYLFRQAKLTVFRERSLRKTVRVEEQVMSLDKYPSIFSRQLEAIVFIIPRTFFATRSVLKIGKYHAEIPRF